MLKKENVEAEVAREKEKLQQAAVEKNHPVIFDSPLAAPKQRKKPIASRNPAVLQFLTLVAEGRQGEAEEILRESPQVALASWSVTDLSKRRFGCITGFQYAVWALDWKMWRMILKYLPACEALEQVEALEKEGTEHGTQFSLAPLLEALETYIKNFDAWYKAEAFVKLEAQWCQQVGGCQLLLPAHVAQEYCNSTCSFHPCPDFREEARSESLVTDEGDWYASVYNGGRLGEKFAYVRGRSTIKLSSSPLVGWKYNGTKNEAEVLQSLSTMRQKQLEDLKLDLRKYAIISCSLLPRLPIALIEIIHQYDS